MIKIRVVNEGHQPLPAYATEQSAGTDPTGLRIELPVGFEAQIRPRSGLALKHGVTVLNTPGTIDSDYRGELKVLLVNFSNEDFVVNDGERIAQMIIARHETAELEPATLLGATGRGEGGYGHTGVE